MIYLGIRQSPPTSECTRYLVVQDVNPVLTSLCPHAGTISRRDSFRPSGGSQHSHSCIYAEARPKSWIGALKAAFAMTGPTLSALLKVYRVREQPALRKDQSLLSIPVELPSPSQWSSGSQSSAGLETFQFSSYQPS